MEEGDAVITHEEGLNSGPDLDKDCGDEDLEDENSPLGFIDGSVVKMKTQCPECGKYLANVNEHIKLVHLKIRNHACSECPYKSCFKNDMEKHMQAVHGKSSYFLSTIKKEGSVNSKSSHFISCGNIKDAGDDVSKIVTEQEVLDEPSFFKMAKVHSEAKTTQCPHCDKFLTNIKEHIKAVHMKEKNYFCNLCDYKTLFKSDLIKHDDLVHRKIKKTCQECGKQVANLPEHVRMVHRKEKNFKCSYCGYSCAKQSDMKKHSKNVHKVMV